MFLRNVLLAIGAVFVLAGVGLMIAWFSSAKNPPSVAETPVESRQAVMVATRAIPNGTLLRKEDFSWKDVGPGEVHPGNLLRGQVSETEFLGAISRRDFVEGEPLIASDFVKPGDRQFLAAVLKPGSRAVSISVNEVQSATGMVLPDDHVDVILTQNFDEKVAPDLGRRTVSENVLRDVHVIAVNQSLSRPTSAVATEITNTVTNKLVTPSTITLELLERQAEMLMVAQHLPSNPTFQLTVRPLLTDAARPEDKRNSKPVWASDVSPALNEIVPPQPKQVSVRIYSGQPKSDGYLCSIVACTPSDVNTVAPEAATQTNQTQVTHY